MSPNIIINAESMMTCVTKDLFTCSICAFNGMERNSKIVMSPLGAINSNGLVLILKILSVINRIEKIPAVIQMAKSSVEELSKSDISNKKPNNMKKEARIRKAISVVISLNFSTSLLKFMGWNF